MGLKHRRDGEKKTNEKHSNKEVCSRTVYSLLYTIILRILSQTAGIISLPKAEMQ